MLRLTEHQASELARAVGAARETAELESEVADVYRRAQAEIDRRRPACAVSGRCCRFEAYGHRLFVTTVELAAFARQLPHRPGGLPVLAGAWDGSGCPFQVGGLCGVHDVRPFGCRAFFCDPTAAEWQRDLYERFHAELRRLHDRAGVPYFYVEWREGLRAVGLTPAEPVP